MDKAIFETIRDIEEQPRRYRIARVEVYDTIDQEVIENEYFYNFNQALEDYNFFKELYDKNCYAISLTFIEDI